MWTFQPRIKPLGLLERKDIIGRQEVPAEDVIGQSQVALEDRRHLGIEVFSAAELLQHLHGHHEDLAEAVLLEEVDGRTDGCMS